ncbi:SusC/RagA family TonB-linked outer membrane protein [Belliella marina]|uniref:SusC/RagA family TonB-linked outer membrane protein n=1 Tax=Belliella marina TaxID=1644146 RepID=A0ABW4VMI0_9BACT
MKQIFTNWYARSILIMLLATFISHGGWAQHIVKGTVYDSDSKEALIGANILIKGTSNGTACDVDGRFTLEIKSGNPVLVVSAIGFKKKEITVGNQTQIEIYLDPDFLQMEDAVVIGYQNIERDLSTASISTVQSRDIENSPSPSLNMALQGKVAGLTVLASSGEPGAPNTVNLRGVSNLSGPNGNNYPLYVVDGVLLDLNEMGSAASGVDPIAMLNPNDVESIDILKDASAAAIYGSRAANGVIIIKTKRPKDGKPQIRINAYTGRSNIPRMMPVYTGAAERRYKMDLIQKFAPRDENFWHNLSPYLTDSLNSSFNNNTDWQGMLLQNATISNMDFSIAQMNEKSSYRVSLGYFDEQGTLLNTGFKRYQGTVFLNAKPHDRLNFDLTLMGSFSDRKRGNGLADNYPFSPWGFPSSFWNLTDDEINRYKGAYNDIRDKNVDNYISANLQGRLLLTDFLSFNVNATGFLTSSRREEARASTISNSRTPEARFSSQSNSNWEVENYLMYAQTFGRHNISAILGQSAKVFQSKSENFGATNLPTDFYKTIQGINTDFVDRWSNTFVSDYSRLAVFARTNYDFAAKYLFSASWRMDGSSRYAQQNKWVHFPSVSVGWVMTEESFFPQSNIVDFLKIRGSYGMTGYDPGDPYASFRRLTAITQGGDMGYGPRPVNSYGGKAFIYPDYNAVATGGSLTWQTDPQWNIGFDLRAFKDRINLTTEIYNRESRNIPFNVMVPVTTGYTQGFGNVASIRNEGVEFTLTTQNLKPGGSLQWSINFVLAINRNMITELPNDNRDYKVGPPWLQYVLTKGRPIYEYSVWMVDGIYDYDDQVPVNPLTGEPTRWYGGNFFRAGDPIRRDINGDYNIDDQDKVLLGNPHPKYSGGFNNNFIYKNWTFGVYAYFVAGRKLWNGFLSDKLNGSQRYWADWGTNSGPASNFDNFSFWTEPGSEAVYPRILGAQNTVDNYHIAQSYFIDDGSFFRIKNIQVGYRLPQNILDKAKLRSVRLYGMWENVFLWHQANLPDPEVGDPGGYTRGDGYPLPPKFTLGVDIEF